MHRSDGKTNTCETSTAQVTVANKTGLLHIMGLCRRQKGVSISEWEHQLIPLDLGIKIRENPCIDNFDAQFLLVIEAWHIILRDVTVLENDDSPASGYWPYALTRLNHLIMRCHDRIYRYYMLDPGVYRSDPDHSTTSVDDIGQGSIDDRGRGVIETDIALARMVVVEFLSVRFGAWLDGISKGEGENAHFSKRRASFNVDFTTMDLEWATANIDGSLEHVWAKLPIQMLFPEADLKHCSGSSLQKKQQEEPMKIFGPWGRDEDSISDLDLTDERIESSPSERSERLSRSPQHNCREADNIKEKTLRKKSPYRPSPSPTWYYQFPMSSMVMVGRKGVVKPKRGIK
ncbi:hypothetical protein EKO27_g1178 [Xylaria grammica]|uniref:Uncharacterized protein n=1 Tax=Xylaria grammica TaxID=363999 RepID=A0A439DHM9_9PEZI|nr:hypothetical protein EKO27_g1178 [Xylaria grammica]